jgi:hypothetical protein
MKTMTRLSIVKIEADELNEYRAVNETLATHLFPPQPTLQHKRFGVIDIWKCRNNRRFYGIKVR